MSYFFQIIKAEVIKQHRTTFHSTATYFSLLIWPVVIFFNAYFSYKPFQMTKSRWPGLETPESIILFLIIGYIAFLSFWTLVQSAAMMQVERQDGTLETIFLSPGNRIAIIYGRVLGALFENMWMFFSFSLLMVISIKGFPLHNLIYVPLCFLILLVSAVAWGGLMNAIFLFSRDASIIFSICYEPMNLLAGVRVPTVVFPIWAKIISVIFPLTHALVLVRNLLMKGELGSVLPEISWLLATIIAMVVLTIWIIKKAEQNARKQGNLLFY
ncbi:MAG: ABC transporter permease [Brevibacillus sp.]|nr:ABC transporter permease [Brevibacillus sp.]